MKLTPFDRILACLEGIATGDAVGKQTELLLPGDVLRWYPRGVRGFEGVPGSTIPRYAGNRKREWRVGETTDDTERTIAVARAIVADRGAVSHISVGREMLRCTKCVHPGVRSLWEFHQAADPARLATDHDGCGAAIRVAPVGILYGSARLEEIVSGAREASISTHGGSIATAAAAATAAAVSLAIDGAGPRDILAHAEAAAADAERRWPGRTSAGFASIVRRVHDELNGLTALHAADLAARCFPNHPMTIVPLALGLATVLRSAEEAILLAANIGGDSDSVASIAAGILGAAYPDTVNEGWFDVVEQVNGHGLATVARQLAALRH
ncbi:MAG TPA: ADP-ribosylglycohydrolase family protein [Vicinamibacterales bacterium]|nr:ADP-ribosylglycohydrolase family protein [Vicinamibacterales bacterium]